MKVPHCLSKKKKTVNTYFQCNLLEGGGGEGNPARSFLAYTENTSFSWTASII